MNTDERTGDGLPVAPCPGYADQGHDFEFVQQVGSMTVMRCRRCKTGPYIDYAPAGLTPEPAPTGPERGKE